MPRGSHTRRSAISISRSTSPGCRLMNLDESSADQRLEIKTALKVLGKGRRFIDDGHNGE